MCMCCTVDLLFFGYYMMFNTSEAANNNIGGMRSEECGEEGAIESDLFVLLLLLLLPLTCPKQFNPFECVYVYICLFRKTAPCN